MKRQLFIDTCGALAFAGILVGDEQKVRFFQAGKLGRSSLINEVDELLREFAIRLDELDSLVVGVGPGSFTGVRVAASYAQAIALVKKIPVITVSSLYFYLPSGEGAFYSILDARRGDVYYAAGVKKGTQVVFESPKVGPFVELDQSYNFVSPDFEGLSKKVGARIEAPSASSLHVLEGCIGEQSAPLPLEIMYLRSPQGGA